MNSISTLSRFLTVSLWAIVLTSVAAGSTWAASTTVVISQLYGGGGNSGATYKNDFIELHNISNSSVSVAGWSVQYAAATGNSWQVTNLTGTIAPGAYYLVQESAGTGGTTALPAPDVTGSIAISSTAGKIALVNSAAALTVANPTGTVDLVGFGTTANGFEGSGPAPAPSNTTAELRNNNGSTDTDNNAVDFTTGAAAPRNSVSPTFIPTIAATQVAVETAADGSGTTVPAQTVMAGTAIHFFAITRSSSNAFVGNVAATWSLASQTGGIVAGDLVPAADGKSATFTPHATGTAVISATVSGLTSVNSGLITVNPPPNNVGGVGGASVARVPNSSSTLLTVAVTPAGNPPSTGITVTADLTAFGGSSTTRLYDDGTHGDVTAGDGIYSLSLSISDSQAGGAYSIATTISDAQGRSSTASISISVLGSFTIFHTNDCHARITPHDWIVPAHGNQPDVFQKVGGSA